MDLKITYLLPAAAVTVTARCRGFLRLPRGASRLCVWLAGRLRTREINIVQIIKPGDNKYLLSPIKRALGLLGRGHLWCARLGLRKPEKDGKKNTPQTKQKMTKTKTPGDLTEKDENKNARRPTRKRRKGRTPVDRTVKDEKDRRLRSDYRKGRDETNGGDMNDIGDASHTGANDSET